ncbi:MAG: PD40 domain-containing protein [Planctomycetaceae bacterium]|nr:PD40 domain-containing protein [Planctomycetaceae bacterium]
MTPSLASFLLYWLAAHSGNAFNAAMKMPSSDPPVKPTRPRRSRLLVVLAVFAALAWSLPRPLLQEVVVEPDGNASRGRLAFRTAERLAELSGKGTLADETELSGPCFADDGQTLYFSRARPGQRADIVRSKFADERWSKPELVRELNSVDDDRRLTLSAAGGLAALASNRSGGHGGFDLYESAKSNDNWSRPRNAGPAINTESAEFDPALTPDGLTMYFVRVVPDASADIFVTRRDQLDSAWSSPEPVTAINSLDHHERSPTVSPDGNWLLFASNRGARTGESAPFGLFRAPLRDGQIGTVERIRDGLASDTDDVDAAFAPDGQSLVFASKREGAKQIFLARGEFVVTQLAISTEHLDRFGDPGKWLLPILASLLLIVVWRWSRRALPVAVAETAKSAAATIRAVPRRSEPPKNPLESWTAAPLEQAPPPAPKVNPLTVAKIAEPITISPPVAVPANGLPSRRRRWAALAMMVAASVAFVLLRNDRTDQTTSHPPLAMSELGTEFAQFADIAPPQDIEFPKLERTDTARTNAPQPIALPSNVIALRPGARWPTDRVTVRQRSELVRVDEVDQRLLSRTKAIILAKRTLPSERTRPLERPGEESKLAVVASTIETPHGLAPTTTTKRAFDPPSAERTAIQPAAATQTTLRAPVARPNQLLAETSSTISDSRRDSLARSGPATRTTLPVGLAEPEAFIKANAGSPAVESPLPTPVVSLSRTESVLVSQPMPLNSSLPIVRRSLPNSSPDQSPSIAAETARPTSNGERARLPSKSPAAPKAVPLTEEVAVPAPNTSSVETNTLSPSAALLRGETNGPQPTLPATASGLLTTRTDLAALRTTNRLEASESANLATKSTPIPLARRETLVPATVSIAAVDLASGMGTAAPAILLTSTSMLVELLTSAPLPALPRAESGSPATSPPPQPPSQLVPWLSRAWAQATLNVLPAATDPNPVSKVSLPRRVRETAPAELVETIPTTP